jgi:hypothetical protein
MSRDLREHPYLIHTNRELGLMLKGIKPLAMFADGEDYFPEAVLRYLRMFDRHVESGRFTRRDVIVANSNGVKIRHIYFALRGEEWRIQAMIDLKSRPGRWTRAKEREEGELLGYTPEQNDLWLSRYCKWPT